MSSTWSRLVRKIEVDQTRTAKEGNDGNKPTPPEACTWGYLDFFGVMPWTAFCISNWTSGSTLLAYGLTVGQAMGAATISLAIITITCVAAGFVGSVWRLSDPLDSRLAWGVRGYSFTLIIQIMIATCWYGIQLVFGYLSVKVVIGALIPSFITMHNSFSDALPTNDFICMIIFIALCVALQSRRVAAWTVIGKIGGLGTLVAFTSIVLLCCIKAGGVGPLFDSPYALVGVQQLPSTSQTAWAMFLAISTKCANYTRFARTTRSAIPAQIVSIMILELIVTIFGILATSAAVKIFPDESRTRLLWAPYDLLLAFQKNGSAGARVGTFFAGLAMIVPQLGINAMWWFTVRRGGYVTTCLAIAIQPWESATKPASFGRFLNGTSILYGVLMGIFFVDYFVIRRQLVKVSNLLIYDNSSIYWYKKGYNWRSFLTLLLSGWIAVPGWISVIRKDQTYLAGPWQKLYGLAWPLCFLLSGLVYYILATVWPMAGLGQVDEGDPRKVDDQQRDSETGTPGRSSTTDTV